MPDRDKDTEHIFTFEVTLISHVRVACTNLADAREGVKVCVEPTEITPDTIALLNQRMANQGFSSRIIGATWGSLEERHTLIEVDGMDVADLAKQAGTLADDG